MPIMFNTLLLQVGLDPKDVRLLRHQDTRSLTSRSPYVLWRDERSSFEEYQSRQKTDAVAQFNSRYWASFVVTPNSETLFVGIYQVKGKRLLDHDIPQVRADGVNKAGEYYIYDLVLQDALNDLVGKLTIDWGSGTRQWRQRADNQDKTVVELRPDFKEPAFPGFLNFIEPLSRLDRLPPSWAVALQNAKGVYLLTCPKTKEQYVGSATGKDGFWQRWQEYIATGHGGNMGLKTRDPSDYQVSILEVAGTAATVKDMLEMEILWKRKLQSREMGLNHN
jgi:hypothetical protein